jgi:hypothetical protein
MTNRNGLINIVTNQISPLSGDIACPGILEISVIKMAAPSK